jgi:hypothetical protein
MLTDIVLDLALDAASGALGLGATEGIAIRAGLALIGASSTAPARDGVLSAVPGRIRLRVLAVKRSEMIAARIERELSALRGVRRVTANPTNGAVTVEYHGHLLARRVEDVAFDLTDRIAELLRGREIVSASAA